MSIVLLLMPLYSCGTRLKRAVADRLKSCYRINPEYICAESVLLRRISSSILNLEASKGKHDEN